MKTRSEHESINTLHLYFGVDEYCAARIARNGEDKTYRLFKVLSDATVLNYLLLFNNKVSSSDKSAYYEGDASFLFDMKTDILQEIANIRDAGRGTELSDPHYIATTVESVLFAEKGILNLASALLGEYGPLSMASLETYDLFSYGTHIKSFVKSVAAFCIATSGQAQGATFASLPFEYPMLSRTGYSIRVFSQNIYSKGNFVCTIENGSVNKTAVGFLSSLAPAGKGISSDTYLCMMAQAGMSELPARSTMHNSMHIMLPALKRLFRMVSMPTGPINTLQYISPVVMPGYGAKTKASFDANIVETLHILYTKYGVHCGPITKFLITQYHNRTSKSAQPMSKKVLEILGAAVLPRKMEESPSTESVYVTDYEVNRLTLDEFDEDLGASKPAPTKGVPAEKGTDVPNDNPPKGKPTKNTPKEEPTNKPDEKDPAGDKPPKAEDPKNDPKKANPEDKLPKEDVPPENAPNEEPPKPEEKPKVEVKVPKKSVLFEKRSADEDIFKATLYRYEAINVIRDVLAKDDNNLSGDNIQLLKTLMMEWMFILSPDSIESILKTVISVKQEQL